MAEETEAQGGHNIFPRAPELEQNHFSCMVIIFRGFSYPVFSFEQNSTMPLVTSCHLFLEPPSFRIIITLFLQLVCHHHYRPVSFTTDAPAPSTHHTWHGTGDQYACSELRNETPSYRRARQVLERGNVWPKIKRYPSDRIQTPTLVSQFQARSLLFLPLATW